MATKKRQVAKGFDLKRVYQRNMLISFLSVGLLFFAGFGMASSLIDHEDKIKPNMIKEYFPPIPPSPIIKKISQRIEIKRHQPRPKLGDITAVPDDESQDDSLITIFDDIKNWAPDRPDFDPKEYASTENIERIIGSLLPKHGVFVACEQQPIKIKGVLPVYPPMAQRAGIEGAVWVEVLIDAEGQVRDVIIYKKSDANAGFEEAAIDAAKQTVWKPAIANGQPVAVWVTYAVKFKLQ